jgi:hypothetical protein
MGGVDLALPAAEHPGPDRLERLRVDGVLERAVLADEESHGAPVDLGYAGVLQDAAVKLVAQHAHQVPAERRRRPGVDPAGK